MAYRSIFVPLAFEEVVAPLTKAAALIAKKSMGHVLGEHIRQRFDYYPPVGYYTVDTALPAVANEAAAEAASAFARAIRTLFEKSCDEAALNIVPVSEARKQGVPTASWTDRSGVVPSGFGRAARVSDLSVAAFPPKESPGLENSVLESLMMDSGGAVLLVPRNGMQELPRRPLVAWDGSLQATRAVRAAMPMLQDAEQVTVLTVNHEDYGTPDVQAAAHWLERSLGRVALKIIEKKDEPVGKCIQAEMLDGNNDLIVMGAYSHSRLYESIIGGVTRYMIGNAERPIFLCH